MNFISICSGIEAASVAFCPLGWKAIAFSEIEPFPCAVLAHHYPEVPNFGDMTKFREWPEEIFAEADAIVGGPPCQAFSVAGLRSGLNDDRGNLTLTYAELINHADAIRVRYGKPPVVVLYENVPGLLSDKTGAFGCFLAGLAGEDDPLVAPGGKWTNAGVVFGSKRTVAWRIFDAQYFGVAQRRRRVFVVASARNGFNPIEVLFESESVRRDSPPSRETRQGVAAGAETGAGSSSIVGGWPAEIACTLNAAFGKKLGLENQHVNGGAPLFVPHTTHTLRAEGFDASEDRSRAVPLAVTTMQVLRRITPKEAERLMGFPDGYTAITWRGKSASECPDGPRYRALGNSWAVPNVAWIGRRIDAHLRALDGAKTEPLEGTE